jgi:hypothetical protein
MSCIILLWCGLDKIVSKNTSYLFYKAVLVKLIDGAYQKLERTYSFVIVVSRVYLLHSRCVVWFPQFAKQNRKKGQKKR